MHQSPQEEAEPRSRWTLALLQKHCPSFRALRSLSGVWRKLKRLRIVWKRGRVSVTSPDPDYVAKCRLLTQALEAAAAHPDQVSVLYGDETTLYRQPPAAPVWHEQGANGCCQAKAVRAHANNTQWRVHATLDVQTGRLVWSARSKMGVKGLVAFFAHLRQTYGASRRLVLIWDNWPVHYNPRVLEAAARERIELLWLPTYAPWLNPIEKVWRKLKEEIIAMHRLAEQWQQLKEQIHTFLQGYERDAPDLLRYVGIQ